MTRDEIWNQSMLTSFNFSFSPTLPPPPPQPPPPPPNTFPAPPGLANAYCGLCEIFRIVCVNKITVVKRLNEQENRKDAADITISRWNHRGQIVLTLHLICMHDLELQRKHETFCGHVSNTMYGT